MSKHSIFAKVVDCDLDDAGMHNFIMALAHHNGKDIRISIERKRDKISNEMHAYYRSVVLPMIYEYYQDQGKNVSMQAVHKNLKAIFGPEEDVGIDEPVFVRKESMSEYTKEESVKFVEDIKREFAEDLYIPDANEHLKPPMESYDVK